MLDDRYRRRRELGGERQGGVGIGVVVVGKCRALQLPRGSDARRRRAALVEGRLLVRVLAIAQARAEPPGQDEAVGKGGVADQPLGNLGIVGGGQSEGLGGQLAAQLRADIAVAGGDRGGEAIVIGGVGRNRHPIVVLGGGADQRHPANVDVVEAGSGIGAGRQGRGKRVEVADEEIDRRDGALGEGREVIGTVAPRQQPAMDRGMQGLDSPVEKFADTGHLGHLGDLQPDRSQFVRRTAGRDQLDAARLEPRGETGESRFVADREQCPADRLRASSCRPPVGSPVQRPAASVASSTPTATQAVASAIAPQPFSAVQPQAISTRSAAITRLVTAAWPRPCRTACW